MRKTKIVCTLGPSTSTQERVEELITAGLEVARFYMSHGDHAEHKKRLDETRAAAQKQLAAVRKVFPDAFVVSCRGTRIVK